jgi:hypothetical protein
MFPTPKNSFLSYQLNKLFRVADPQATAAVEDYGALKNSYMAGAVAPSPGHPRHVEVFQ